WLEHTTRSPEPAAEAVISQTPDFIADTARLTGFTKDGELFYTLYSPRLIHIPATDLTFVEQPRLHLISHGRNIWVNADKGEVGPKGERADFFGSVDVKRDGIASDPPMHLSTEQLAVWPQEQRAVSDVPVRLTQGAVRTDANSFEADNIFGVINLTGKVRMYLPSRHQRKS
ncbi:MAG: LPS export ABC transporter periplasmic protein LptC, partial [Betaproteobacteria bacterium]|nr:LPS export ABC transporter periplasmic protein LptC [Betaproteobacteria bacterium]